MLVYALETVLGNWVTFGLGIFAGVLFKSEKAFALLALALLAASLIGTAMGDFFDLVRYVETLVVTALGLAIGFGITFMRQRKEAKDKPVG